MSSVFKYQTTLFNMFIFNLLLLTCGNDKFTYDENVDIFHYDFEYIVRSNSFLIQMYIDCIKKNMTHIT
jgi:hypothetical protein